VQSASQQQSMLQTQATPVPHYLQVSVDDAVLVTVIDTFEHLLNAVAVSKTGKWYYK